MFGALSRDDPRTWQESSASDRERLMQLEKESDRSRENVEVLREEIQATRYLAEKVGELALDVRDLASRVESLSRHALQRPSTSGLAVFGQYVGLAVAVIALIIATGK